MISEQKFDFEDDKEQMKREAEAILDSTIIHVIHSRLAMNALYRATNAKPDDDRGRMHALAQYDAVNQLIKALELSAAYKPNNAPQELV